MHFRFAFAAELTISTQTKEKNHTRINRTFRKLKLMLSIQFQIEMTEKKYDWLRVIQFRQIRQSLRKAY